MSQVVQQLEEFHFLIIHHRDSLIGKGTVLYVCGVTEPPSPVWCLATLTVSESAIVVKVKPESAAAKPFVEQMFVRIFAGHIPCLMELIWADAN